MNPIEKKETNEYHNHSIRMKGGELYVYCHKTAISSFGVAVIDKTCPYCGYFGNSPIGSNRELDSNKVDGARTQVICKKCNLPMEETSPNVFYCVNGHKAGLFELVDPEKKPEPKPQTTKRRHAVEQLCPFCGKVAEVVEESKFFGKIRRKYTCGHTQLIDPLAIPADRDEKWNDFFDFQKEAIQFVEEANYSAMMNHEMGLGKTIIALGTQRYNYEALTPTLFICESSKVYDWKKEWFDWVSSKKELRNGGGRLKIENEPIIHNSGQYGLVDGFNNHIISMSLLQKPKVLKSILEYGFKFMVVDESHSFKNEDAERTYALQQISRNIPYKLFLTGTPLMNKVEELFVPLNILRPSNVPSKAWLIARCDKSSDGKRVLGISKYYRPRFFDMTESFVLRRTKKDVKIQLPALRKYTETIAITNNKMFVKGYNDLVEELDQLLDKIHAGVASQSSILGIMAKLRHFVGIAKVMPVIQKVEEFMESMDTTDKITVGVHHKDVMDKLRFGLAQYNPIVMSDESPEVKMNRIEQFKKPESRLLIASILGCGQGLNLQFCANAMIAEREWNPAKEEQFSGRFHRPMKDSEGKIRTTFGDDESVTIDTINAKDTIDEFLDSLLELKRGIVDSTVDKDYAYDPNFLMELAEKITATRLKLNQF